MAPCWDLIKAFSSLGKGAAVLGRAPRCWQHPCMGRGWARAENISLRSWVLQHLAAGEMGTSLDKPGHPLFAVPSLPAPVS